MNRQESKYLSAKKGMMEHYLINNNRQLIRNKNQYAVKWEASAMQLGSKYMSPFNLGEYPSSCIPNELEFIDSILRETYK